jgi:hypothetical protein
MKTTTPTVWFTNEIKWCWNDYKPYGWKKEFMEKSTWFYK